jgi:hypothetical protein
MNSRMPIGSVVRYHVVRTDACPVLPPGVAVRNARFKIIDNRPAYYSSPETKKFPAIPNRLPVLLELHSTTGGISVLPTPRPFFWEFEDNLYICLLYTSDAADD